MTTQNRPTDESQAAGRLGALGNLTRLRIYRLLVRAGDRGLNVGDLQRLLDVAPSTLAHHLASLVRTGLVRQTQRGREVVSRADYAVMDGLVGFLTTECCTGVPAHTEPHRNPHMTTTGEPRTPARCCQPELRDTDQCQCGTG